MGTHQPAPSTRSPGEKLGLPGPGRYVGRFQVDGRRHRRQARFVGRHYTRDHAPGAQPAARPRPSIEYVRRVDRPGSRDRPTWFLKWRDARGEVRLTTTEIMSWGTVCRRSRAQLGASPDPRALTLAAWRGRLDDALAPLRGEPRLPWLDDDA